MKNNFVYSEIIKVKDRYLTDEEFENEKANLTNIVNKLFPNLPCINQKEFLTLKEKINNGDKTAERVLKDFSLKVASENVVNYYLTHDVAKYEFGDALQDLFLIVEDKYQTCMNAKYLCEFEFYIASLCTRCFVYKLKEIANSNLDIKCSFDKDFEELNCVDEIYFNKKNEEEYYLIYKDLVNELNSFVNQLSPRDIKIINLYFGLNGNKKKTMPQIAKMYNITYSAIQGYISQALKRLIQLSKNENLKDYKDGFEL